MLRWCDGVAVSPEEVLKRADAVLVMTVDGRAHLANLQPVFATKKPVYVGRALSGASSAEPIWSTSPLPSTGVKMDEITRGHQAFINMTAALLSSYPLPVVSRRCAPLRCQALRRPTVGSRVRRCTKVDPS